MSDIKPIDLPSAAGVEFGRGDVRHFSEDDALDVPSMQNPTRHLAERDNQLAAKVNEVVEVVNNKEQFVPLSIPRTTISPGVEEVVSNFRIPDGFEARVLNAAIGSSPASATLALKIYYATGYGNATGTELVSTTNVFSSGVAFYNTGEFIVAVRNNGSTSLEAAVSITLTIRPIGSTASLLVGSVIRGDKGLPGREGGGGKKGDPGVGGAGTPGLIWSGYFYGSNTYAPPQAVSFSTGGVTSSYISKVTNPGPGSAPPPDPTYWDLLASGNAGAAGAGLVWRGPWLALTPYALNDAVSYSSGGLTSVYICKLAITSATTPPADTTHWDLGAGPGGGETPTWNVTDLSSTTTYTATVTGPNDGIYGAVAASGNLPAKEYSGTNTIGTNKGLVFIYGQFNLNLPAASAVTVTLPTSIAKVSDPWTNAEVAVNASAHGTHATSGTIVSFFDLDKPASNQWRITSLAPNPIKMDVTFFGMKIT